MVKKYDKAKAHDYYMKHRKLKGRRTKVRAKTSNKSKRKKKYFTPKNVALLTRNTGGKATSITRAKYDELSAKLAKLKEKVKDLPPAQKKALKGALIAAKGKIKKG